MNVNSNFNPKISKTWHRLKMSQFSFSNQQKSNYLDFLRNWNEPKIVKSTFIFYLFCNVNSNFIPRMSHIWHDWFDRKNSRRFFKNDMFITQKNKHKMWRFLHDIFFVQKCQQTKSFPEKSIKVKNGFFQSNLAIFKVYFGSKSTEIDIFALGSKVDWRDIYRFEISMSTPVNNLVLRGALLSQKSKFLNFCSAPRSIHTMTANMAGHRVEKDTFGNILDDI